MIDVDYRQLPPVFDPLEAMRRACTKTPQLTAAPPEELLAAKLPNGLTRLAWRKGDVKQAFGQADVFLEHTFRIPASPL